ncbi:hypothetical protein [Novipirellula artificiosorum]|uniref:Pectate lyase superfamily protein n=1 Tax=Novipirellula artificiosorum TaxID=2528016 RepID=A0A5C6D4H4_9BACT|nr:hypothetical protein [Novipirellula artificiosorum]TWU31802.1 hypothetical protein Poly41_60370 [Novipirellula artificiosorum]
MRCSNKTAIPRYARSFTRLWRFGFLIALTGLVNAGVAEESGTEEPNPVSVSGSKSVQDFGVLPTHASELNRENLQRAIDWASPRGAALYFDPSDQPYRVASGIVLRRNVSLIGVHGPVGRGTRHPDRAQPVGSVLAIEDQEHPFITVEGATQIRGLQFWYPHQTLADPEKIVEYPPTIRASDTSPAQGVTLSCLTFFGEFTAMDFRTRPGNCCEQVLVEHCYGYPLSGQFVLIDHCYDIPRLLHCHINPANRRFIDGGYSRAVVDRVIARKTFAYWLDHTDNAQIIDVFTFGTYGGIRLGPATYGQLTNFNFDCVTVGIHKLGNSAKNRNWQIAQGSIIANTGTQLADVHPIIIEGKGHTALMNVEAFSGSNGALTTFGHSQDFLWVRGDEKLTVSLFGCRMRNYVAAAPITVDNPLAVVQAVACIDNEEEPFQMP